MMKASAPLTILLLALFTTSCVISGGGNYINGNGNVTEESRDISGFTGIHVSSGIDVLLSEGETFEVVVEADENLQEVIETELRGEMLEVGTIDRVNIRNARSKRVHVTLPGLETLIISSAGDCEGQTLFHCGDLRLNISSAGDMLLEVEADRIDLDISSSGNARLSGSAGELDASLSSAGDLDAYDLVAEKVDVSVSSAGDARVHATKELSMSASSAGSIYYRGGADVIHSSESSAGNIIRKD
ncbi:MAG: head GIN domain-containing protein [Bacteroidota bacterium]